MLLDVFATKGIDRPFKRLTRPDMKPKNLFVALTGKRVLYVRMKIRRGTVFIHANPEHKITCLSIRSSLAWEFNTTIGGLV